MTNDLRFLAYREQVVLRWTESPFKAITLAAIAARREHGK